MEEKIIQAGKIAKQVIDYAKSFIKKDIPLLEIAEKIEDKINELGGKPAFPTNLSINDIAAHYTPTYNDETLAHGLLKVDLGVHIDGYVADTAFSIDLENSEENKQLIQASREALTNAIQAIQNNGQITLREIGATIAETISKKGFASIVNLSGHEIEQYDLHAGLTIPNYANTDNETIYQGTFAIEPFATTGNGKVYDGKPSGIYQLNQTKQTRSPLAREILEYIFDEYQTLPFCSRWIVKKFGVKALFALRELEIAEILHQYSQLVEVSHKPVSQAEHTVILKEDGEVKITTA